jgi:hypothetical protein
MPTPEVGSRDLLREAQQVMESAVASAANLAGRAGVPQDLLGAMRRQIDLAEDLIERERRLQRSLTGRLAAPVDAVFDLFEETAVILRRQSEALEAAGRALEETAGLFRRQSELFERSIGTLRQPAELAKVAAGLDRRGSRRAAASTPGARTDGSGPGAAKDRGARGRGSGTAGAGATATKRPGAKASRAKGAAAKGSRAKGSGGKARGAPTGGARTHAGKSADANARSPKPAPSRVRRAAG